MMPAGRTDLDHLYGGDLQIASSGDLRMAANGIYGQQRVLRRLLTNAGDDMWNLQYGAGLPAQIGLPAEEIRIAGIARTQLRREAVVAAIPAPVVTAASQRDGTVVLSITYADAFGMQALSIPIGG